MKEKTHSQTKETREKPMSEMADKAMKGYEQAIRTGLKLQEEATRWWANTLTQTASPQDWQKRFTSATALANGVMPLAQRRMEEVLELMEKNSRTGAELLKKAADAAQTPVIADSQAKWMDFWAASVSAARYNAEAVTEINSRAMDAWINFVRQNTEVTEVRIPKAA